MIYFWFISLPYKYLSQYLITERHSLSIYCMNKWMDRCTKTLKISNRKRLNWDSEISKFDFCVFLILPHPHNLYLWFLQFYFPFLSVEKAQKRRSVMGDLGSLATSLDSMETGFTWVSFFKSFLVFLSERNLSMKRVYVAIGYHGCGHGWRWDLSWNLTVDIVLIKRIDINSTKKRAVATLFYWASSAYYSTKHTKDSQYMILQWVHH